MKLNEQQRIDANNKISLTLLNCGGCSVTNRVNYTKQPDGGFLSYKLFTYEFVNDDHELISINSENPFDNISGENISPSTIGLTVDYLTRFKLGHTAQDAFNISLQGAMIANELDQAKELLSQIKDLDDNSIINAARLVTYDVCFRARKPHKPLKNDPDDITINHIKRLVIRTLNFLNSHGPIVSDNLTFPNGYTPVVSSGDGDYLLKDGLIDLKVSMNQSISSKWSLQLLLYFLLGLRSNYHVYYQHLKYLGIYNARYNVLTKINVNNVSVNVINEVTNTILNTQLSHPDTIVPSNNPFDL